MLLLGTWIRCLFHRAPWILLPLFAPCLLRADTTDFTGTLPEDYFPALKSILQDAVGQSPQVLLAHIRVAQKEAGVYDADRERWPNVGSDIRYAANQTAVSSNANTKSRDSGLFYSVSANQAVFHWGEIKNKGEIARIEVLIGEQDYAEAYRLVAVELRRAYLGLIVRNAELRYRRYAVSLLEAQLADAKDRLAQHANSEGDVAGRELTIGEFKAAIARKEVEFDSERRRFSRMAGMADIAVDQIPLEIPLPPFDAALASRLSAALLRDGAKGVYGVEIADMHIRQAELDRKIANVRLLPKFDASLGHSRESSTTASQVEVSQTAITRDTLQLAGRWSMFDGWATKGAKLQALTSKRLWERQRQTAAESAMDEAQRLERLLAVDASDMGFAEAHRAGAAGFVDRAEGEQKAGTISSANVNEATSGLRLAEFNSAITRATFLSDWSAFISLVAQDPVLNQLPSRYARAKP
jgi:outer membrane protein TolC